MSLMASRMKFKVLKLITQQDLSGLSWSQAFRHAVLSAWNAVSSLPLLCLMNFYTFFSVSMVATSSGKPSRTTKSGLGTSSSHLTLMHFDCTSGVLCLIHTPRLKGSEGRPLSCSVSYSRHQKLDNNSMNEKWVNESLRNPNSKPWGRYMQYSLWPLGGTPLRRPQSGWAGSGGESEGWAG